MIARVTLAMTMVLIVSALAPGAALSDDTRNHVLAEGGVAELNWAVRGLTSALLNGSAAAVRVEGLRLDPSHAILAKIGEPDRTRIFALAMKDIDDGDREV